MHKTMRFISAALLLAAAGSTATAQETLLAGWDFQTTANGGTAAATSPNTPTAFVANVGSGNLYLNGTNGSSSWSPSNELTSFAGTTVNSSKPDGMPAGFSSTTSGAATLTLLSGTAGSANGKSLVFTVNTTGYSDVTIWYAAQRTTSGFTTHTWEYSTDGTTWSPYTVVSTLPTSFAQFKLPSTSGPGNAATAYFRLTVSGSATTTQNNRLDNFQILGSGTPLPMGLLSFSAGRQGKAVTAVWSTAQESGMRSMELQRSAGDAGFETVAMVAATNTPGEHRYEAVDARPLSGRSFYRLAATDVSGLTSYSQTVAVAAGATAAAAAISLQVSPNPVLRSFSILHPAAAAGARITILGPDGRTLAVSQPLEGSTSTDMQALNLPPGSYIAVFENSGTRVTAQFVK